MKVYGLYWLRFDNGLLFLTCLCVGPVITFYIIYTLVGTKQRLHSNIPSTLVGIYVTIPLMPQLSRSTIHSCSFTCTDAKMIPKPTTGYVLPLTHAPMPSRSHVVSRASDIYA